MNLKLSWVGPHPKQATLYSQIDVFLMSMIIDDQEPVINDLLNSI